MPNTNHLLLEKLLSGTEPYTYVFNDYIDQFDIIHNSSSIKIASSAGLILQGEYELHGALDVSNIKCFYKKQNLKLTQLELNKTQSFLRALFAKHSVCSELRP